MLNDSSWMNNLPLSWAAVEIISVSASGSSTSTWGRWQESQGASRGGGGPLLGALHGGWAIGPQGTAYLHWLHAAWLLPSAGWAAWHCLPTLWPADDCHQEERPRVPRAHPRPGCPPGQWINAGYLTVCSLEPIIHVCSELRSNDLGGLGRWIHSCLLKCQMECRMQIFIQLNAIALCLCNWLLGSSE